MGGGCLYEIALVTWVCSCEEKDFGDDDHTHISITHSYFHSCEKM
jgi:hypothetical protein